MKRTNSSRTRQSLARAGIVLIVLAMITGIAGCYDFIPSRNLEIRTWYDLDRVRRNLRGHHRLMNDLDASTAGYDELAGPTANEGRGWKPIGDPYPPTPYFPFRGTFDGQGYEIRDLYIRGWSQTGLFTALDSPNAVIENLGVVNASVTGYWDVGGLVGTNLGTLRNCYVSGTVVGETVGNFTASHYVGGLVGWNTGVVVNSHFNGDVSGAHHVGGLVGWNAGGTIRDSYSTGSVQGLSTVGGLVGSNAYDGTISSCYSTGSVTGDLDAGGFVGVDDGGPVRNSFWDVEASGMEVSAAGTGKSTAEMMDIATFANTESEGLDEPWDIVAVTSDEKNPAHIWNIVDGISYPFLSWQE